MINSFAGTHPPPATATRKTRRRRRPGGGEGGTPSSTPLQHWTLYNNNNQRKKHLHFSSDVGAEDKAKFSGGGHAVDLSARKLAAGLWRLRSLRYGIGGFSVRRKSSDRSRFKPGMSGVSSRDQSSKGHRSGTKHQLPRSQSTIVGPKQGSLHKNSKSLEKGEIERGCRCSKASPIEAHCFASHMKLLEDQVKTVSFVSALQAELVQAQLYIRSLEYEVRSSRHRVKHLVRKLGSEGTSQQKKEHEKIYALVDDLKCQLSRERRKQSQLIKELAEAKLSSMQSLRKYEAENRIRKLLEEVCRELARKIGEDEAEVEAMRIETMRIREEIEEEKSMLHVAEVWREERVQMKMIDANLALESKYSQLNKLITVLETFLMSRNTGLDMRDLRKAALIGQAIKAVSIQDMEEISYESLGSVDIFSIFEELRQVTVFEREIEPWFNHTLTGDIPDYNSGMEEDAKGDEKVHYVENRGSVEQSDRSIITVGARRSIPRFEIEQDKTATRASRNTETNGVCSISAGQPKRKKSSLANLQTSYASSSEAYNLITSEQGWTEVGLSKSANLQTSYAYYDTTDLVNQHVTRGMKGCIEWPRDYDKNTLKAKSEAGTENKKSQLHTYNTSP